MFKADKYVFKRVEVDAVQVSEQNMDEILQWIDGERRESKYGQYILIKHENWRDRPRNPRLSRAYIGDWIVKTDRTIKVYTKEAFENNFEKHRPPVLPHAHIPGAREFSPKHPSLQRDAEVIALPIKPAPGVVTPPPA